MKLDKASTSALVKLTIFLVVTGFATALLMQTIGNFSFGGNATYRAAFTDATGVTKGDDVRIAGVRVGSVRKVEVRDRDKAVVTFTVRETSPLTTDTTVQLRFRNLIGQRYLALAQNGEGQSTRLKQDTLIPLSRTQEALDLSTLLNGFKPVFQALSPADTNKLAFEIVQTLQGEGGNVQALLARTSSLTRTLADRDQLIGDVVTNLSETLDIIGSRDRELTSTIDTLQQFVTGLKNDRGAILNSIDSISDLSVETSNLLVEGRPDLTADVEQLNRLTRNLSKPDNLKTVDQAIKILPIKMRKFGNLASNGSLFNFYTCSLNLNLEDLRRPGPGGNPALADFIESLLSIKTSERAGRCSAEYDDAGVPR